MQTAAISYRVADFLRRHAPFEIMDEADLLALASRGRVKFHEADEFVCWQGESHGPHLYVIQQGSVSLWEKDEEDERLRDIRGPGDIVGLERFLGQESSQSSARTNGDVVLYALHAGDFEPLIAKYREVRRYLASHGSVNAEMDGDGHHRSAAGVNLREVIGPGSVHSCKDSTTIRAAARMMTESGAKALAVEAEGGGLAGAITSERLTRWIADGGGEVESPLGDLMEDETAVVAESARLSDCVLAMGLGNGVAVVTQDGSRQGAIRGVVAGSDLTAALGEDPVGIVRRIRAADDCDTLRRLHHRARAFMLAQLGSTASVDWLARYGRLLDESIARRVLQLAGAREQGASWCFYGASGRGEVLTPATPQMAVITEDEGKRAEAAANTERVLEMLACCGFVAHKQIACASLAEWEERFGAWISDPVRNGISLARPYFDLRPVQGAEELWSRLESTVKARLRTEPGFTFVLAHDCLANLPPLTFFRDLVVEESGARSGIFSLEHSALTPLVDVARVFGVAAGSVLGSSSLERFDLAQGLVPEQESMFLEAAETLRVVLFHQARAGIRQNSEGFDLPAAQINTQERLVLKSGFRSILRLLEFTAEFRWQETA